MRIALLSVMFITAVIWVVLEVRHSNRFGIDRGPMPSRTRNLLMLISFIAGAALTFWETQHGNTLFYQ